MPSETENQLEIAAIKADLALKKKFSQMNNAQKRDVIDQLFPSGVAFHYTDPKIVVGDWIFGSGDPDINSGGFWFGKAASNAPIENNADVDFEIQN